MANNVGCVVEPCDVNSIPTLPPDIWLPAGGFKSADNKDTDNNDVQIQAEAINVYQVALPIIFGLIIILGIVGNIMVIYIIAARGKMRTVTNFLLLNLAVADVAFLAICGPFTVTHYALTSWPLGYTLCRTVQFFLYVTCYVTVYTLVAVAVVRYLLVVKGGSPACVNSSRYILFIILGIWMVSLLINIPVPLTFGVNPSPLSNKTECVISCQTKGRLFFPMFFVFAYALPLLIITTLYFLLVRHLRLEQQNSMIRKSAKDDKTDGTDKLKKTKSSGSSKSAHVTRVLILVVAVFALCWLPLHVHLLAGTFGKVPQSFFYTMTLIAWHALVFLNSALNPLIYNLFSSEFRESFRNMCKPGFGREGSVNSGSGSRGTLIK